MGFFFGFSSFVDQQLNLFLNTKKHVDGAGKVDGSIVVALPIDRWSDSHNENQFEGGGLTFWDGYDQSTGRRPEEIHYDTRSGDVAFIDRYVQMQLYILFFKSSSCSFVSLFMYKIKPS